MAKGIGPELSVLFAIAKAFFATENFAPEKFIEIQSGFSDLIKTFETEWQRIRDFEFEPNWKNRVINVPKSIQAFKNLANVFVQGLTDDFNTLAQPFQDFHDKLEGIAAQIAGIQAYAGGKVSGLVTGLQASQIFVSALNDLIGDFDKALSTLDFADTIDTVITNLEGLDALFLQQGNSRRQKSGTSRIRVGKLHR
jgi:hypothetical protein